MGIISNFLSIYNI